ncbi:hypothetical protein ABAC402_12205 [Asticcacaulis sp. AC402]|nr:hypothetical protein ABAC402_12205 [Asticcacaulis sp. AC402]
MNESNLDLVFRFRPVAVKSIVAVDQHDSGDNRHMHRLKARNHDLFTRTDEIGAMRFRAMIPESRSFLIRQVLGRAPEVVETTIDRSPSHRPTESIRVSSFVV